VNVVRGIVALEGRLTGAGKDEWNGLSFVEFIELDFGLETGTKKGGVVVVRVVVVLSMR